MKIKKDSHQERVLAQTRDRIIGLEVRIECNLFAVEVYRSVTMISLLTKLSISLKEATCTIPRASKISEIVTQIQFRGETAFKVKLELVMALYHLKTDKMLPNKEINLRK